MIPAEPTADQCSAGARMPDVDGRPAYATWYPQMGGYSGKCVVVSEGPEVDNGNDVFSGGCFEAYVWHDGEFPFGGDRPDDTPPVRLHHCDSGQFRRFADFVDRIEGLAPPAPPV